MLLRTALLLFCLVWAVPAKAVLLWDVDGDQQTGVAEAIYALRLAAGLASQQPPPAVDAEQAALLTAHLLDREERLRAFGAQLPTLASQMGLEGAAAAGGNAAADAAVDAVLAYLDGADFTFACGQVTVDTKAKMAVFTFDGSCSGVKGEVRVEPERTGEGTIVFHLTYTDLQVDGCAVNGTATLSLNVSTDGSVSVTHTSADLAVCGVRLNGTVTATGSTGADGATVTVTVKNTALLPSGETVALDLVYSEGSVSGTITVTDTSGGSRTITCTKVGRNPNCPLPTGVITLDDGTNLDFSTATCDDPTVTVSKDGVTAKVSLADLLSLANLDAPTAGLFAGLRKMGDQGEAAGRLAVIAGKTLGLAAAQAAVGGSAALPQGMGRSPASETTDLIAAILDHYTPPSTFTFECGTVQVQALEKQLLFTFASGTSCGLTGTATVAPILRDGVRLNFQVAYDLTVEAENCAIKGAVVVELSQDDAGHVIVRQEVTGGNLYACGVTLAEGTVVTVVVNESDWSVASVSIDGMVSVTSQDYGTMTVDGVVTLDVSSVNPKISGSVKVTLAGGAVYVCTLNDLVIDTACGLPVSGTVTFTSPVNLTLDFSQTTCDNPEVAVTIRGFTYVMDLAEVKDLLAGL